MESERSADVLEDLEPADRGTQAAPIALDLAGQSAYMAVGGNKAGTSVPSSETPAVKAEVESLRSWTPSNLSDVLPNSHTAMRVLEQLVGQGGSAAQQAERVDQIEDIVDYQELMRVFRASNELRRQFWVSLPPQLRAKEPLETQPAWIRLEKLAKRIAECEERVRAFRVHARNQSNLPLATLLLDILEQLSKASDSWQKYKELQLKKRKRT